MRILLAEDERTLSRALVKIFEKNHFSVDAVYNGEDALSYLETENYDVAVFDIMMPKMDGLTALKQLRAAGNRIPVLLLTAKTEVDDRIKGLDSGANYYLTKPFETRELLAVLRTITRSYTEVENKLYFGNVTLDRTSYELSSATGVFCLANKEYQMIELLMSSPRRVFSTAHLLEHIWGLDNDAENNIVWVYISYLRKKLKALEADFTIKSSRNLGYSLEMLS